MTTITANNGFQLRMDGNGNISELNSYWENFNKAVAGTFSARLIKSGPYFTTYTLDAGNELTSNAAGKISGVVSTLFLTAASSSSLGRNGLQLTITGAEVAVERAPRLPVSLFVSGDDIITGSSLDDIIQGATGNDDLAGRQGRDFLYGGDGNDTLVGGARDADRLYGGRDDDVYFVADTRHVIIEAVGEGQDTIGASVSYVLAATSEVERITALGTKPIDLTGSSTANEIIGNGSANVIHGRGGEDTIFGLAGNDTIEGGQGADQLSGGRGRDQLSYAHSTDAVIVNLGDGQGYAGDSLGDLIIEFEEVIGSKWSDRITGDELANTLNGAAGNDLLVGADGDDILIGGRGHDSMIGGFGYDRLDYGQDAAVMGVVLNLTLGTARDGFGARDTVSDFEEVRGTRFNDVMSGSLLAETLKGEKGNDRLNGRDGNDRLFGGTGNDSLTGGGGQDIFVFNSKPDRASNVDRITDFTPGDDLLYLDNAFLKNIGFEKRGLRDDFFHLGKKAEDLFNRIIYDKATGSLYHDPDGIGAANQVKIAVIGNKANIDSSDFFVI